jgi:hypothetical protein
VKQLLYGIYYILGLRNQLNFITTIFVHELGTYHSLTERELDQNSVIQTIYNFEAKKMDAGWYTATPAPLRTDSFDSASQHFRL